MSGIPEGDIRVTAFLAGGIVRRVAITAHRPLSLASAMAGRPIELVADAMAALHGLCGQSHAAAVHFAAAAARGESMPPDKTGRWLIRLAGERLGEHMRSLFTSGGTTAEPGAVRGAIAVGQGAARTGAVPVDAASRLAAALAGMDATTAGPGPAPVDALSSADDAAVIAALAADTGFIRAPHLPGRVPETGPAARRGLSATDPDAAEAARIAELRDAAARLLDPGAASPDGWITAGPAGPNAGYATVETPRGRLYYRLVLDGDGKLQDARVLAPTEWNFQSAGPLVRALTGFRPGPDAVAAITRRAAAFDPCVALLVSVESAVDA